MRSVLYTVNLTADERKALQECIMNSIQATINKGDIRGAIETLPSLILANEKLKKAVKSYV